MRAKKRKKKKNQTNNSITLEHFPNSVGIVPINFNKF